MKKHEQLPAHAVQAPDLAGRRAFLRQAGATAAAAVGAAWIGPAFKVAWAAPVPHALPSQQPVMPERGVVGVVDPVSHSFATAFVESSYTVTTPSDGDLWPSCWADDDHVYAANGDGKGFSTTGGADMCVSQLSGMPETGITGVRLVQGKALGSVWADPKHYNRKPTGMLAVDGNGDGKCELYLAVQNLHTAPCPACFNDAPMASVLRSDDYGRTWHDTDGPMFTDHKFTTVFFLDFGKAGEHARVLGPEDSRYAYAYGIDYNWRDPTDPKLPSTTDLYLARVPKASVQDRSAYRFFAGLDAHGKPVWARELDQRKPVLHDARTVYPKLGSLGRPGNLRTHDVAVISQGSVVYNAPLKRYIYTSWTWYTFEFYDAPTPWGPWRLFLHKDFGAEPFYGPSDDGSCPGPRVGGYPTTIPSKYISDDGRTMWVQTSTWKRWNFACGKPNYSFGLRKLTVTPYAPGTPQNTRDAHANLAVTGAGVTPIEKSARYGHPQWLNDANPAHSESSHDGDAAKPADFWGYVFTRPYHLNRVGYVSGPTTPDGGWFDNLHVQVRQQFQWVDVERLDVAPAYPHDGRAGPGKRYVLNFAPTWGDGVRIIGKPGGWARYTTIAELEVYFA